MNVKASFWAEFSAEDHTLVPAGVLVAGKREILFKGFPEFIWLEQEMKVKLTGMLIRGLSPEEILDYYAQRSNGVTVSVSRPETVEGRSLADAADRMLERSKHYV